MKVSLAGSRVIQIVAVLLFVVLYQHLKRRELNVKDVLRVSHQGLLWLEVKMTSISPNKNTVASESTMVPQFILFGDSITQGSHRSLIPDLSDWYLRKLDVLNRGFSGYTAPMGLEVLPHFFSVDSSPSISPRVRLMSVFFGANDACLPGSAQHVPLEEYTDALRQIARHEALETHGTKLVFITPGPVDEYQIQDGQRKAANTAKYAAACKEVASDLNLPVLDLWSVFMTKAGWKGDSYEKLVGSRDAPKSKVLAELLTDGLHFTDQGYSLLYEELKKLIEHQLPKETADSLPVVYPDWKDVLGVQC